MKRLIIFITVVMMFVVTGCYEQTASEKESNIVDKQLEQFSIGQPVPTFDWSLERDMVIKLYHLRNQKVATHSVWRSDYGMIIGDTPSLGYGLPYDTSLTNPLQLSTKRVELTSTYHRVDGTIEMQEPNGIYASKNTSATWIMSVDKKTGQIMPIYTENKVDVYPYPVKVDYETNRVYRAGEATSTLN